MKRCLIILIVLSFLTGCSKKYTVTFINDDKVYKSISVEKGKKIDIDNPNKDGYIFVNWLKDEIPYDIDNPVNEDITLTASWIEVPKVNKTYTVTFKDGKDIKTKSVKEHEKVDKPDNPEKEKYTFIGWFNNNKLYDFNEEVTEDILLEAKYELLIATIFFDLDGGTGIKEKEVFVGSILEKPNDPSKFGYRFLYWTKDNKEYKFQDKVIDNMTLKAVYIPIKYVMVSFDTDGGNSINSKILEEGSSLEYLETPKKDGYKFLYWSYDDIEFDISMKINTDITLKAVYDIN